jgi:hypothetical protein
MMMISTDGWRAVAYRLFSQLNAARSTRLDVTTHQALYTMEYKDITRSQVNACRRMTFRPSMQIPADRMIASAGLED